MTLWIVGCVVGWLLVAIIVSVRLKRVANHSPKNDYRDEQEDRNG